MEYREYWRASRPGELVDSKEAATRVQHVANSLSEGWTLVNVAVVAVDGRFVLGYFFTRKVTP